ncbi:hypothetical protein OURE66S_03377 [Oligella ureolytica]
MLIEQASLYIKLKSYAQAHALLEQIQPEDDEDAYVRALLMNATLSREQGEFGQGLEYVERALKYYPDNIYIRYSQAMMFEHMGRLEQSIEVLEQILLDFPFETESYNGLGYVLADNNIRLDDAVLLIERALAMAPDSVHIQVVMAGLISAWVTWHWPKVISEHGLGIRNPCGGRCTFS